jgi:hypothetical protein
LVSAAPQLPLDTVGTAGPETQAAWRDAGFDGVECFWRQGNRALIGGYRAS